jgi:hypothetical protein
MASCNPSRLGSPQNRPTDHSPAPAVAAPGLHSRLSRFLLVSAVRRWGGNIRVATWVPCEQRTGVRLAVVTDKWSTARESFVLSGSVVHGSTMPAELALQTQLSAGALGPPTSKRPTLAGINLTEGTTCGKGPQ